MIEQLKDLKDTYESARSQIDRGKEPLDDLIKVRSFLQVIAVDITIINEKVDKDYKKFFFEDFTIGLLKRLTRERSKDDKYLEVIAGVLESYMDLFLNFLKAGQYNVQFFDSIKLLFEFDSILHNYNYQIPEDQLKTLRSSNQEWRKDLKEGDMVDAIIDENNTRCSGWSQARISSVNGDILQLEFIYDSKNADRYLDRWSVEIAIFETKTKETWEWKKTLETNNTIDAHDKTTWNKSTILDMKEQIVSPGRTIKMAYVGYRIYVENGTKSDEKGSFDGWSNKFDEWIPIYSPRIQPFYTKTQKGTTDDLDLDEDYDNLLQPEEGFTRVYAVPRLRKCISSLFIHLINYFGNHGGFDLLIQAISKQESEDENSFNLTILANLVHAISYPFPIYHKEFIQELGPQLVELCIKKLREAPEKSLRDVRREKIESIIKSVDNLQKRLIAKEDREKQTEILKLEVSLMCLKSSYLERRIQGIRDLNQIIKNNRMFYNKNFTGTFLIEWMQNNGVFSILFDTKKTHLQLVQRCSDILKLLLSDNMFSQQLMEAFWSLAKSDYKFEVYKIINEVSFYLKNEHIDFFFEQIKQVPAEKLAIEEFQCLSELGKFSKDTSFKSKATQYFWSIICNSDNYKEELIANCITKFSEMVKNWDLRLKHDFFIGLTKNLACYQSSVPCLRLFKGLIKDQKDRYVYNSSPQKNQSSDEAEVEELTLAKSIEILIKEHNLTSILFDNLKQYCTQANLKLTSEHQQENRKKLYIVSSKYSHFEEIDERLSFIRYIAQISADYQVSKDELGLLYQLLVVESKISGDYDEFLTWCKSSCEQSSQTSQILDLNQVGEFFTEKMKNGELDVKNLLVVGFEFLQQYFLSVNETSQKLIKSQKPKQTNKFTSYNYSINYGMSTTGTYGPRPPMYFNNGNFNTKKVEEEPQEQTFKIQKQPSELDQLDIVWNIALHCENPKVVPKAIDFLIKVYYSLDNDLDDQRTTIQADFIDRCMGILANSDNDRIVVRVIEILKNIIFEAEKKGTGDIKPHNALLKGELLEKIIVKNKASPKTAIIQMNIYSNTTFWEFKKEVAKQLDLAPKYLRLERIDGKSIKDTENGRTLAELEITSGDTITAYKMNIEEEIPTAPLIGQDGRLTEKIKQIFNEWYDMYSDEQGSMTKETCALFIKGCTGEYPSVNDERILNLFKTYDINGDGRIERSEFFIFYEQSARSKPETVRENLRAHNIRNDLKKLSEIHEDSSFASKDMPRLTISKNQKYFDLLISLLDKSGTISQASWDLIQMLATNEELYKRVLQLQTALNPDTGKIDWEKFFDSQSVYKLLYTLQIVEAVMEEGEGEGLERVIVVDEFAANKKNAPQAPPLPGTNQQQSESPDEKLEKPQEEQKEKDEAPQQSLVKKHTFVVSDAEQDNELKQNWTKMFLENQGFQYILKIFMEKQIKDDSGADQFELKHIAFLLKLLRIFLMAAFSTSKEAQVYDAVTLARKNSSAQDTESQQVSIKVEQSEGSRFKELQKLLEGPISEEIIQHIDYKHLQQKILSVTSQIITKKRLTFEDKLIIENALNLWAGCVLHMNELFNDFYQFQSSSARNADTFVLQGLLFCDHDKIREEFKQALSCLSNKLSEAQNLSQIPLTYLLKLLSDNFQLISQYQCRQYFELFCELIDQYFMCRSLTEESSQIFNPENLLALIIDKIKDYNKIAKESAQNDASSPSQTKEDNNSEESEQENIYIGLIHLTGKIIDNFDISFSEKIVEQKNLIDEIFVHFLFSSVFDQTGQSSNENLKIKPRRIEKQGQNAKKKTFGKKSKDAAYKLLNSLIRKSPLLMNAFMEKSMVPLMKLIKRHDGWNYTPPGHSESKQKYCGLRNLGNICYMNSMLQQFFMIPAFRYNLLSVDDKIPDEIVTYKGYQVDDNMLHQLQKLMAHLELSERNEYNPFEFCFSFKDFEGNPTNTGEQKDAQEFLSLAFDRIENMLKGTSRKYLMQSVFGGQTCSQMVCQECGKVKNRIEDFLNLSLTVKDIKSMQDSLQKMIEGEVINDFMCDNCKKRVDISRRTLISKTPNVLIVHLQRIIFNFETFRNDKINSFFEFPYHLDLKPYSFYEVMKKEKRVKNPNEEEQEEEAAPEQTKENNDEDNQWPEEEDCYEYKLVGTTVHTGTANAGHYWSYINTRRGYNEPEENDQNWPKTETDPWMEFNDSTVRDFNFEKLRDECFGGDGRSGNDDPFSFGGSYGKSAYMLVYERRKKRPIKILASEVEVEQNKDKLLYDDKKEEYYKLVEYRDCANDIAPNNIYKQVFEDNQKFEFENDIYSSEFFDFIKGILQAVAHLNHFKEPGDLLDEVKAKALFVGKKAILDLLSKCFYNNSIKFLVESLIDILKQDDELCKLFLKQCFEEDGCNYLFEIMLECTDSTSRLNVGLLIKFVLNRLKKIEKDQLFDTEIVEGENGEKTERFKALSSRFIGKCLQILNTQIAKNWSRFDNLLEILYGFAVDEDDTEQLGLQFYYRNHFIEKACDFLLGKKSPLSTPGEKRIEMGGSFNSPNFAPIIKLVINMITNDELLAKYPLNELEQKMFLHQDLLKVMLGSSQGSKQFGQCLANMCKDNIKMSLKVSKVFIKAINNSNYDNVKSYLTALKPFLKLEDSLKIQKLEWVFGFGQLVSRKNYREEKYKYGLELVDRINEDAYSYVSPVSSQGSCDDSLFSQLLKCKGKLDTFAINCLQEMLSLMAKDDDIARFVFEAAPPSYQNSRYSDWIRPYLEFQKSEVERANAYAYFKNKHDAILKSLGYLEKYEEKCEKFKQENQEAYGKFKADEANAGVLQNWLAFSNSEVINHFPPGLIIGKQTQDDKEFIVLDEDPLVKVQVNEVVCEYNYSNPTGFFNLSLPHIELKTSNYQTVSYLQHKRSEFEYMRRQAREAAHAEQSANDSGSTSAESTIDPQEEVVEEMPEVEVKNWFENKKEEALLLKVLVTNKQKKKVTVKLFIEGDETTNAYLPTSYFKEKIFESDTKLICHIQKINPEKPWGTLRVRVEAKEQYFGTAGAGGAQLTPINMSFNPIHIGPSGIRAGNFVVCSHCQKMNDFGMDYCDACGESLNDIGDGIQENYFGGADQGTNAMY